MASHVCDTWHAMCQHAWLLPCLYKELTWAVGRSKGELQTSPWSSKGKRKGGKEKEEERRREREERKGEEKGRKGKEEGRKGKEKGNKKREEEMGEREEKERERGRSVAQ